MKDFKNKKLIKLVEFVNQNFKNYIDFTERDKNYRFTVSFKGKNKKLVSELMNYFTNQGIIFDKEIESGYEEITKCTYLFLKFDEGNKKKYYNSILDIVSDIEKDKTIYFLNDNNIVKKTRIEYEYDVFQNEKFSHNLSLSESANKYYSYTK